MSDKNNQTFLAKDLQDMEDPIPTLKNKSSSDKNNQALLAKFLQDMKDRAPTFKKKSSNDFAFGEKIPFDILESEYKEKFIKEEFEKIFES